MVKIKFIKKHFHIDVNSGSELLEVYNKNTAVPLKFGCRQGHCGTCAIKIVKGAEHLSKMSSLEREILRKKGCDASYRLACQCAVNGSIEIE